MSDGWDYQKRQQEIARAKQELTHAGLGETPDLAYFRASTSHDVELCVKVGGQFYVLGYTAEQMLDKAHHATGLALHAMNTRKRAVE